MSTKVPVTLRITEAARDELERRAGHRRQRAATYGAHLFELALKGPERIEGGGDPTFEILWRVEFASALLERLAGKYPELVQTLRVEAQQAARQALLEGTAEAPPVESPPTPSEGAPPRTKSKPTAPADDLVARVTGRRR